MGKHYPSLVRKHCYLLSYREIHRRIVLFVIRALNLSIIQRPNTDSKNLR